MGSKIESTSDSVDGLFSFMPATNSRLLVPSSHSLWVILTNVKEQRTILPCSSFASITTVWPMIAPWRRRGRLKSRPRVSLSTRGSPCWWSPDTTAQTRMARRGSMLGPRRRGTMACWGPTLTRPQVARRGPHSVFALRHRRLSLSFCRTHAACVFEFGSKMTYLSHVESI